MRILNEVSNESHGFIGRYSLRNIAHTNNGTLGYRFKTTFPTVQIKFPTERLYVRVVTIPVGVNGDYCNYEEFYVGEGAGDFYIILLDVLT